MSLMKSQGWLRAMPAVFVLIWSTGFIVARYGMPYAPPLKFLAVRYALSLLSLCTWVFVARIPLPVSRSQWGHLAVTGLLMQAGYLGGVWAAVHAGMGSGLIALLVGMQPVLTAVWLASQGGRFRVGNGPDCSSGLPAWFWWFHASSDRAAKSVWRPWVWH